jgi:carbonic anhydrase/acetyltransferase-like protein (isoleucine patch superfamily)
MIRSHKGKWPEIAATAFVDDSAQVIGRVKLGEHASVWMNCVLRGDVHDITIGAYSNIQDNSVLHGHRDKWPVVVGESVSVGHAVTLHGCVVEDCCLIGIGAIILDGARIGTGSIIAAGSVVMEGTVVEPHSLWAGVPAKFRKTLDENAREFILRHTRNYARYKDEYLSERRAGSNKPQATSHKPD